MTAMLPKIPTSVRDRESKWTKIYCGYNSTERMFYYVRIVPEFMDTEAAGSSHGIAIGGDRYYFDDIKSDQDAWDKATGIADFIDNFLGHMIEEYEADQICPSEEPCGSSAATGCHP